MVLTKKMFLLVEQLLTRKTKVIQGKEIVTKVQSPVFLNTINNMTRALSFTCIKICFILKDPIIKALTAWLLIIIYDFLNAVSKNVKCYHYIHFPSEKNLYAYENLPEAEKEKIRANTIIMDKFSISWEAYHELAQQDQTLPRSYLVKGCQGTIDSRWNIRKAPGDQPGAELPLEDLLKQQIDPSQKWRPKIQIR